MCHTWEHFNPDLDGLFTSSFWREGGTGMGGGEVKLLLVYNPLELCKKAWHLVHKYTHACSFRKHYFQFIEPLHFADVSRFFCCKSSNFTQSNSMRAVLEIFGSVFSFCKVKGYYKWKCKYYKLWIRNLASGLLRIDINC